MKTLSETWFAEGYIDFELKKYTLLAYLQDIHHHFSKQLLYPQLSELIFHYNNIIAFKENKEHLQQHFPKKLTGIQIEKLQLLYEKMVEDDELMQELEAIIQFAGNTMKKVIVNGTEIYESVESTLNIFPVGIVPLHTQEGYFFLSEGSYRNTYVYNYRLSIFEKHDARYRSIISSYVDTWQRNMVNTYESIKSELIRTHPYLPNPAVYSIETDLLCPMEETLLPIAKRSLVRYISLAA